MGRPPAPTPALLITMVGGPPNQSCASAARQCTSSICDTSQRSAERIAAVGVDRVGGCAGGVFIDVAAHHATARAGEFDGECGADAAARSGDDGRGVAAAFLRRSEQAHACHPAAWSMVLARSDCAMKYAIRRMAGAASGVNRGSAWKTCT